MGCFGLAESAGVNRAPGGGLEFAQSLFVPGQSLGQLPGSRRRLALQVGQQVVELGLCLVAGRRPVGGAGNGAPMARFRRDVEGVLGGEPVVVVPLAVARPFDAVDECRRAQLDLHPGVGAVFRDPASRVSVPAIVDERELMDGIAAVEVHARRSGLGPGAGQRDVFVVSRRENLEFIDARLGSVGPCNVEADKSGLYRFENFLVAPRINRRLKTGNLCLEPRQFLPCRLDSPCDLGLFPREHGIAWLFNDPLLVVDPGENGLQRVVVAHGHRVEFMVVTAGTAQRQP